MIKAKMNITVSIVEDDGPAREILADWINRADNLKCISQYGSVELALEKLPAEKPSVILMDINLPGVTGIEGIRKLKPLLPGTQFMILTVYEDVDHVFDALAAGATGYLLKQTPRSELLDSIKDVYAGGSPMTSNIARRVVQAFHREDPAAPESEKLSQREREVLELLARGYLYKEIMSELSLSRGSVNTFIRRIYEKLHVRSRSQAVAKFSHFSLGDSPHRPARN
jgi:DNA-binding NarL/FixJ family response regulator